MLQWSDAWALSLAYAVTRSFEEAERIVADTAVALASADVLLKRESRGSDRAVKFARAIYDQSLSKAFRLPTDDSFFALTPQARAVCVLKSRARFAKNQICDALRMSPTLVDEAILVARHTFSGGRSWLESSAQMIVDDRGTTSMPECPYWKTTAPRSEGMDPDIESLFAQYVDGELLPNIDQTLHRHFLVCSVCRTNLDAFRARNNDWLTSVPRIEAKTEFAEVLSSWMSGAQKAAASSFQPKLSKSLIGGFPAMIKQPTFWMGLALVVFAFARLYKA